MTHDADVSPEPLASRTAGVVRRAPIADLLAVDGESLVLLDDQVLRLGPVATVVLQLLGEGTLSHAQLTAALEAQFGPPPEGSLDDAVEAQLNGLAAAGLITRDNEPD